MIRYNKRQTNPETAVAPVVLNVSEGHLRHIIEHFIMRCAECRFARARELAEGGVNRHASIKNFYRIMAYVYILTSKNHKVLYIGVTTDLGKRINEHKSLTSDGYTKKYKATKLVYYETYDDLETAILREKQLKGWLRIKKTDLITLHNPEWEELEV